MSTANFSTTSDDTKTDSVTPLSGSGRLAGGYGHALRAADLFFGAFVLLMVGIAFVAYLRDRAPLLDLLLMLAFLAVNIVLGEVGRRLNKPFLVELIRVVAGGSVAFLGFLYVTGPLAPWWPGLMVLSLGGAIGFGLLTAKPTYGRAVVSIYLTLFLLGSWLGPQPFDIYQVTLHAGVIATVGLMFAEIMSLLGKTLALEAKRSEELQVARDALFAEVEVAQAIQTLLLPETPEVTGHSVAGKMVTATEVGGDYYDVFETPTGRSLLAIGDVSGHGVTSGLTMMMARTSLVGAVEAKPDAPLGEFYCILNRCIRKNLERMKLSMYMTFALLEHHGEGRFTAVGRHLPLMIYRRASASVEELELTGMWLGVVDDLDQTQLNDQHFSLAPGDLLFLFTDGVVEQFAGEEMFGFERLKDLVAAHGSDGSAELIETVIARFRDFSSKQDDDLTMLVLTHTGEIEATLEGSFVAA